MSWLNSYSTNYSNEVGSKYVYKILEDGAELNVHHIVAASENIALSVEELRLKSKRESAGLNRGFSNYGQESVTPDRYSIPRGDKFGASQGVNSGVGYNSTAYNPMTLNSGYSAGFNSNSNLSSNTNNPFAGFFNTTQSTGNGFGGQTGNSYGNNSFFAQTPSVSNTNPNMFTSNPINPLSSSFPYHSSSSQSNFPTNYSSSNPFASFTPSNNFFAQPQNSLYSSNSLQFTVPDLNSQNFSQRPMQLSTFFRDPYGLSYIFPGKDPEELLKNYKMRDPGPINVSVAQRILGSKANLKFTEKKDPPYAVKPRLFKRPKKTGLFNFPPVKEKFKEIRYDFIEDDGVKSMKNVEKSPKRIDFIVEIKGDERYNIDLSVYPDNLIAEIKENIVKTLNNTQEFHLKLKDKTLQPYETVAEAGIHSGDILLIEYIDDTWPTLEMLPQSKSLKMFPPVELIAKMSIAELKNIENLTLENENGKIIFEGKTDVLGLDFDKFLKIEPKSFQGFPESDSDQRLNKPAQVHLYNIEPGKNPGKMEVHLRISCEQQGTEFIKYNPVNEEFIFKIFHL